MTTGTTSGTTGAPTPPENPLDTINTALDNVQNAMNEAGDPTEGLFGPVGDDPNNPSEYVDDPFEMDTGADDIGQVPDFGGDVDIGAAESGLLGSSQSDPNAQHTTIDENGNVTIAGGPETREVQDEELTSHQLNKLLSSDSKYMQDARRQGLEQAAAMGGLGGTAAAGASMQAAVRAGLPIAQADAQAFQQAASENMAALNQYAQLNLQRATDLQKMNLDAKVQMRSTAIQTNASLAISRLESATKRDISMLDQATQLRAKEMEGKIQSRLAAFQYKYNTNLENQRAYNDLLKSQVQGEYGLANTELTAQWEASMKEANNRMMREATANQLLTQAYDGYMNRLADLNNTDMDKDAFNKAKLSIDKTFQGMSALIAGLYPDLDLPDFTPA